MTFPPASPFSRRAGIFVKQWLLCATVSVWLAGCVSMTSATTTLEELGSAKEGAIVLSLVVEEMPDCKSLGVALQNEGRFNFPPEHRRISRSNVPDLTFWRLAPGRYRIVGINCLKSWTELDSIGVVGFPANYAEITVEAAEVVNGGEIVFSGSFADRTVEVRDLPAGSLEKLAKEYPALVSHMKKKYVSVDSLRTNQSETLGLQAARTPRPKTSTYYYYTGPVRR